MPEIKLVMRNRTHLDLIFRYNDAPYNVPANRTERATVEAGHRINVSDPHHTRVTRQKIEVESDLLVSVLDRDVVIDCDLVGWKLQLHLGVDLD
jgi:hypothetical protein